MRTHLLFVAASMVVVDACTSAATPPTSTSCDATHLDLNGDTADGCEYACTKTSDTDAFDANFTDENCDGSDGDLSRCYFVASDGVDLPAGGTRGNPVKTLAFAVSEAAKVGKVVCVGSGVYAGTLKVVSGVSVYGGFDSSNALFRFRRAAGIVSEIQAEGTGALAEAITLPTELGWLKFTVSANAAPGSSVYGVRMITGTAPLTLTSLQVQVGSGRDGAKGESGGAAEEGKEGRTPSPFLLGLDGGVVDVGPSVGAGPVTSMCGGVETPSTKSGAGGNGGSMSSPTGEAGSPGAGGASGGSGGAKRTACPGGNADDGTSGAKGADGSDGPGASGGTFLADGQYVPGAGTNGTPGGAGFGGGGGGGGGSATVSGCSGAGGSSGGSGGCGGNMGKGGGGGGASIGVSFASGSLVINGGTYSISVPGSGGAGGVGGGGGKGGAGGAGKTFSADSSQGGAGGTGGTGGKGGGGGGGAGGTAACIALHDASRMTTVTQPQCELKGASQGGAGSSATNAGAKGKLATLVQY